MKQQDCGCPNCKPVRPRPMQRVLLPKILASGREWLRRSCVSLQVEGLPNCLQPPYGLVSVSPCGEAQWESLSEGRPLHLRITVPLLCQVRDGCGCLHSGHSCLCVEMCLQPQCSMQECWRGSMMILPSVRLICAEQSCGECFSAQIEMLVEAYLLRWEPCATGQPCPPRCPELPLYPQPCQPCG